MNNFLRFDGIELWHLAGWTMLHFLWIGGAIGLMAGVSRIVLRGASPAIRYAAALGCFALLAAAPVGISTWLVAHRPVIEQAALQFAAPSMPAQAQVIGKAVQTAGTDLEAPIFAIPLAPGSARDHEEQAASTYTIPEAAAAAMEICVPYLPWLWIVGAPITFVLLATGVVGADRLRRTSRAIDGGPIVEACRRLCDSMRITRQVAVAVCERIAAPVLVGILRPVILLPPSALTGWSPDEIEMVLLHELAHVRRWDNLINLAQRFIESLLFFHPVVWWVSGWVRREREACCDAVVVGRTNRPHAYAEMLVALAAQMPRSVLFHPAASSAMAAGPLRSRIRRILQLEDDPMLISGKSLAIVTACLLTVATLTVLYLPTRGNAEESTIQAEDLATEVTENTESKTSEKAERSQSSSDDWPAGFVFASEEQRLIANKAWQLLRLVLVEPKEADLRAAGISGGLRVAYLGTHQQTRPAKGAATASIKDKNRFILIKIGRFKVSDFDELAAALAQLEPRRGESIPVEMISTNGSGRVYGLIVPQGGGGMETKHFVFPVHYPADIEKAEQSVREASEANRADAKPGDQRLELNSDGGRATAEIKGGQLKLSYVPKGKFPTLEEQKLADLAWKILGLELEPIGDEDLKRVKAHGYDGGLEVTGYQQGRYGVGSDGIQQGDILVGLHAWPTTSLQEAAAVLNRDDLGELNPLKFYVVRSINPDARFDGGGMKEQSDQTRDIVVTGRIVAGPIREDVQPPAVGETFDAVVPMRSGTLSIVNQESPIPQTEVAERGPAVQAQPPKGFRSIQAASERLQAAQAEQSMLEQELKALLYEASDRASARTPVDSAANGDAVKTAEGSDESAEHYQQKHLQKKIDEIRNQIERIDREVAKQTHEVQEQSEKMQREFQRLQKKAERQQFEVEAKLESGFVRRQNEEVSRGSPAAERPLEAPQVPGEPPAAANALQVQGTAPDESFRRPATALFPYSVRFEQGASRFLDGDKITILEVQGTAETFVPGHFYWIKGTYKLGSHDRAQLAVYNTAKNAAGGSSETWKVQWINVDRGNGTFELFLPMSHWGWPHVSFYPVYGGSSFGGTYFGTGDFVLKKWWDSPEEENGAVQAPASDKYIFWSTPGLQPKLAAPPEGPIPDSGVTARIAFRSSKPDLRYDGKTFDQWREVWRSDLSPEKRLEAVKALAAFGASGYGREAADAVIVVAGQYDWTSINGTAPAGALKEACLDAFSGRFGTGALSHQLPSDVALEALLAWADSEDAGTRQFVAWGLARHAYDNPEALSMLLKLSRDADERVRNSAFEGLPSLRGELVANDKLVARFREGLASDDRSTLLTAIQKLGSGKTGLHYVPELFPLLYSEAESVRCAARQQIQSIQSQDAPQVVDQLLAVLDDKSRKADHIEAIRALAALGPRSKPAVERLKGALASEDESEHVAAAAALQKIVSNWDYNRLLVDALGDEFQIHLQGDMLVLPPNPKQQEFNDFSEAVDRELETLFAADSN